MAIDADSSSVDAEYRYAAFISYRHTPTDRKWAKWLHTALETYRVPARLRREQSLPARVGRVFRDEDELPASAELKADIDTALRESRFLIVICSPRTPESLWVNREVERFRELARHDRILAMLVEGEPAESFPPALREIRRSLTDDSGTTIERIEEVEPLAADVRPRATESPRQQKRMAQLRLSACLLGVRFDELRQREQERRTRRLTTMLTATAILMLTMGGLTLLAVRAQRDAVTQRNEARHQRSLAVAAEATARARARESESRLAGLLVLSANRAADAGRAVEGHRDYARSRILLTGLSEPTTRVDLSFVAHEHTIPLPVAFRRFVPNGADPSETDRIQAVALLDDAPTVLTAHGDGMVRVWNPVTNQQRMVLRGLGSAARQIAIEPRQRLVACDSENGVIAVWSMDGDGQPRFTISGGRRRGGNVLAFDADGRGLLVGDHDNGLTRIVFDRDGGDLATERIDDAPTFDINQLPARSLLLCAGGKSVRLWDRERQVQVAAAESAETVWCARFADDAGEECFIGSTDGRLVRRNLRTGRLAWEAEIQPAFAAGISVSPDGKTILVGTNAGVVHWRDASNGALLTAFKPHRDFSQAVFSTDGKLAISAGIDGTVSVTALRQHGSERRIATDASQGICFTHDGRILVSCGMGGITELWDVATGQCLRSYRDSEQAMIAIATAPDRYHVATGATDQVVRVYDPTNNDPPVALNVDFWPVCLDFAASENVLAIGGRARRLVLWDFAQNRVLQSRDDAHEEVVAGVRFCDDGKAVLTWSGDGTIKKWDRALRPLWTLALPIRVNSLAFGSDPRKAIAAGSSLEIGGTEDFYEVDLPSRTIRKLPTEWRRGPRSIACSPDRALALVVHEDDHRVTVWDLEQSSALETFQDHSAIARFCAWSLDGRAVATSGEDGLLVVRDLHVAGEISQLQQMLIDTALDPNTPTGRSARFESLRIRGLPALALATLPADQPPVGISSLSLGRAYWLAGDKAKAAEWFNRALAIQPEDAEYLALCLRAVEAETPRER